MSIQKMIAGAALVAAVGVQSAAAQDVAGGLASEDSVLGRARPEYDALGIRAGGFLVFPILQLGLETIDNVFSAQTSEESDVAYVANGTLQLRSQWLRHGLNADIGANTKTYQDFGTEDRIDEFARGDLRLDFLRDSFLRIGASYSNLSEPRYDPAAVGGTTEPLDFDVATAAAEVSHVFNRLRVSGRYELTDYAYDANAPLIGGGFFNAALRDRQEHVYSARAEYEVSPSTALLVEGALNDREYDRAAPASVGSLDSNGYSVLFGVNTSLTRLVSGEVAVGFLEQEYDNAAVGTIDGLAINAELEWFATPITTVSLRGQREIQDVFDGAVTAYDQVRFDVSVDHELRRNVIVNGGLGLITRDFNGRDREEDVVAANVGARYLLNRSVEIGGSYSIASQESSGADAFRDYDTNRFLVTLTLRR